MNVIRGTCNKTNVYNKNLTSSKFILPENIKYLWINNDYGYTFFTSLKVIKKSWINFNYSKSEIHT